MKMQKLSEDDIRAGLDKLSRETVIYAPIEQEGRLDFRKMEKGGEVELGARKTIMSAKKLFLPQAEELFSFRAGKRSVEIMDPPKDEEPLVLFACRPCEMRALEIMDKVFNWDYADSQWNERRARATIIVFACLEPLTETCFCNSLGIDSSRSDGADAIVYTTAEGFFARAHSEKGKKALKAFGGKDEEAPEFTTKNFPEKFNTDLQEKMMENFESPIWKEVAPACIGCGICTFVCPTCHCFDIQDEDGRRVRLWDYCTGADFTLMLAHQPRPTQYRRYRQKVMHKYSYYPTRFGEILCTGCGRCIDQCPQNIDFREVLKKCDRLAPAESGGEG